MLLSVVMSKLDNVMIENEIKTIEEIVAGTQYSIGAFDFVRRGLDYTVGRVYREPEAMSEKERHVSGEELCEGLRRYAIQQHGYLARTVLRRWRINRTEDFGRIVFAMVNGGVMHAMESDSIHDFDSRLDFARCFDVKITVDKVPITDPQSKAR